MAPTQAPPVPFLLVLAIVAEHTVNFHSALSWEGGCIYPRPRDADQFLQPFGETIFPREGGVLQEARDGAHVRGSGLQRLADAFGQHHHGHLGAERLLVGTALPLVDISTCSFCQVDPNTLGWEREARPAPPEVVEPERLKSLLIGLYHGEVGVLCCCARVGMRA